MVGYWQGCRLVIIAFGLILMFMSAADALRRQCSPTALSYFFSESSPPNIAQCQCGWALVHVFNAKNSLSRVKGYSPEHAVLGIAKRLPGSVVSSQGVGSITLAEGTGPESEAFRVWKDAAVHAELS